MIPWYAASFAADPTEATVQIVRDLYLDPVAVEPKAMLRAAGRELEDHVPWLLARDTPAGLSVHHAGDPAFVLVPWPTIDALPGALHALADAVRASGHPLDDEDPDALVLAGMVEALDPHSRVLTDERLDRFTVRLSGTLVGVGATFELRDDAVVVSGVLGDSPASRADLRVGDQIVRIDGHSTRGMPLSVVGRRVGGDAGTQVTLRVARDGGELDVVPVRAEVVVPNVSARALEGGVGYVAIDHMSQRTVENLLGALRDLRAQGSVTAGLVIDLRGNTGGSMKESARLADLFVPSGELLRTVGRGGRPVENLQARMVASDGDDEAPVPVAILVDDRTASGAEILAGALLELDRAVLVGRRTYGKGTVQKVYDLTPDTRLKLTVARYVLANGRSLTDGGLVPDVTVGRLYDYGTHFTTMLPPESSLGVDAEDVVWQLAPRPDLVLELARRAVVASEGPTRAQTLAALQAATADARIEQDAAFATAAAGMGADWTPGQRSTPPRPSVTLDAEREDARTWRLTAVVHQPASDLPLHHAVVELRADDAGWWDGLWVPIGTVVPGDSVTRTVTVDVDEGEAPRLDAVTVRVRSDEGPPVSLPPVWLPSAGPDAPEPRMIAHLLPATGELGAGGAPLRPLEVVVQNLSREDWTGVEIHLDYPEVDGVELVDWGQRVGVIRGRDEHVFRLVLEVDPAVNEVPLAITVAADGHGDLARWPVTLADAAVALQAPRIEPPVHPLRVPAGAWRVPVEVRDDGALGHVTVAVDGRKVAWLPGGGPVITGEPSIELTPGAHRVRVVAIDAQGLESRRTFRVVADPPLETVDAAP